MRTVTDFACKHCKRTRFIGRGEGQGRFWLQCKACSKWQWVVVDTTERADKAQLEEARIA
jgi:hypothetical protein